MMTDEPPRRSMPLFLKVVMIGGAAFGAFTLIAGSLFLSMAQASGGPYVVNGERVTREEFMDFAFPLLGGYMAFAAVMLVLSWGLQKRRSWARPLLLALAAAMAATSIAAGVVMDMVSRRALPAIIGSVLVVVVLWWQLYHDDDVLAYYDAIREEKESGGRPSDPDARRPGGR